MATLGSLVITLEANMAKLDSDLGKAATMVEVRMNKIQASLDKVKSAFVSLGVGVAVERLAAYSESVMEATAHLGELSAATGMSVPALSSLAVTAKGVGLSVDDAAQSFDRMQRNAAMAVGGSRAQAAAFAAVGINASQLAAGLKNPEQMLLTVAGAMEKFADDGNKTALMMTIFGKGGAGMTSMLHELVDSGYENANATAAQAKQAQEYERTMAQLSATLASAWRTALLGIIPLVKMVGAAIFTTFSDMWIDITEAWDKALDSLSFKFVSWRAKLADIAKSTATSAIPIIGPMIAAMMPPPAAALSSNASNIEKNAALAHAQNARIMAEASLDYVNITSPPAVIAQRKLPSIVPPATRFTKAKDDISKQMAERLKVISDAMKAEDAITKASNMQLDADYKNGLVSVADYAQGKSDILNSNTKLTQSLYDSQIAVVETYIAQLNKMVKNETDVQKKQTEQRELEAATAKAGELASAKALDLTKATEDQIALTEKVIADQKTLARTILDTSTAYATMTGDTETANALSVEQQYAMTKQILLANGQTDSLRRLMAVEEDRRMRSSRSGTDGMMRAVIDYQKGLMDVAKQTEAMTSKMLSGMEDALVSFVQTGKLSFKSLIDAMIADLIRLMIRQSVMPFFAQLAGSMLGMPAAGASTSAFTSGAGGSTFMAGGGDIIVGERGPERFRPATSGTVIPNGASGGMTLTYAPVIQIDSRSDRAQVQADAAAIVRKGNEQLVSVLRRYNPGLRV